MHTACEPLSITQRNLQELQGAMSCADDVGYQKNKLGKVLSHVVGSSQDQSKILSCISKMSIKISPLDLTHEGGIALTPWTTC